MVPYQQQATRNQRQAEITEDLMIFDSAVFSHDGDKVLQVVRDDMATVRTGRAKPSIVENVMIEAYGSHMRLMEVAMISAPDTNMIVIVPWDKSLIQAVEKGVAS